MSTGKFAFMIHPLSARDVARKYPIARFLPDRVVESFILRKDPMLVSHISGIKGKDGSEAEGWFIGVPLTPRQFMELPQEMVWERLQKAAKIAEDQGAGILGLGAFTSVVGDGGATLAKRVNIAITTGNSFTVATAVTGTIKAAQMMEIEPSNTHAAIVGAGGSIGKTSAKLLARVFPKITLVGRSVEKLHPLEEEIRSTTPAEVEVSDSVSATLPDCDVVVTVSSAVDAIIQPEDLKPGAVVCDVARPRDVSVRVSKERDDVLVIEGGVVKVPGNVEFGFDFGFPEKTAYACMSETMSLALAERYESFTLGKDVSVEQVDEINRLTEAQGFELAGFRSFERAVDEADIAAIRAKSKKAPANR